MLKVTRIALGLAVTLLLVTPLLAQNEDIKLSGSHFNLNILAKNNCPGDDLKGTDRHTIMVKLNFHDLNPNNILGDNGGNIADLDKTNKIMLGPGTDFQVTDGNACDKDGATLILPDDIATNWDIYVRELGKPVDDPSFITTCGISAGADLTADTADDEVVCALQSVVLERKAGKPRWQNATVLLTSIPYLVPIIVDGVVTGYTQETALLFDDVFYQYFWDYDNYGLRLVQLRFYAKPVVVQ